MSTLRSRLLSMSMLSACLALPVTAFADEPLDEIVNAWKRRQGTTVTLKVLMDQVKTRPKGTLGGLGEGTIDEQFAVLPANDTTKTLSQTLVLDGDKMLHGLVGEMWSASSQVFEAIKMTSVTNGEVARSLHFTESATNALHSNGFIHDKPSHPDRWNLYLAPVLRHYRPFSTGLGTYAPDKWVVVDPSADLNGTRCVLVREGKTTDVRYKEFWVDPAKDMAVVQYQDMFRGEVENTLSVGYQEDAKIGWVPATWEVNRYSRGKSIGSGTGTLREIRINETVDADTFHLEFPPGTEVSAYGVGMFIVRPDGEFYEVTDEDRRRRLKYIDLLERSKG